MEFFNSKEFIFRIWILLMITCTTLASIFFDYEFDETKPFTNSTITPRSLTMRPLTTPINIQSTYTSKLSPYQVVPGSYAAPDHRYYINDKPYNPSAIYSDYLSKGPYLYYSPNCRYNYNKIPKVTDQDVSLAFQYAAATVYSKFPEYSNSSIYKELDRKEVEGHFMELATEYFAKFKCFSKYQLGTYLPTIPIADVYLQNYIDSSCLADNNIQQYQCLTYSTSKYRTLDGACNNLKFPHWGRTYTCHIRLLPPDYSDGVQALRMSKNGAPLPNPRTISNYVTISKDLQAYYTSLMVSWGQFINHDMSETGTHLKNDEHENDCCGDNQNRYSTYKCCSVTLDNPADVIKQTGTKCFNVVRSTPCSLCKLGPREQTNTATSFLDGSHVYGTTAKVLNELRTFNKGQLLAFADKYGNQILPPSKPGFSTCQPTNPHFRCFKAGDNRVNQNPLLMTMHTIMMRNHNYHAYKLSYINPKWSDDKLFEEARRITIAEIQHITMNEYLPIILGPILMEFYRLTPKKYGFTQYESYTDPSTWNEFVTAASRYGHSQMKDYYSLYQLNYSNHTLFALKDNFFEPGFAWDGQIEEIVRGLVTEHSDPIDPYYTMTAKNYAVKRKNKLHGIDMVTTNIERGRDHGIPGYVNYLKACFNYPVKDWKDLEKFIPRETLIKLKNTYNTIDDIDLYVGGISERHFIDAAVGPTFGCLVGIQYYHLKFGDRYFYEHSGQIGSFTEAQLNSIRGASSMAKLLCRNSRNLKRIQPKPFYMLSKYNQLKACTLYPEINYLLWKE